MRNESKLTLPDENHIAVYGSVIYFKMSSAVKNTPLCPVNFKCLFFNLLFFFLVRLAKRGIGLSTQPIGARHLIIWVGERA